jgi:hypothetical protein
VRLSAFLHLRSIDCYCAQAHIGQKIAQCSCVIDHTSVAIEHINRLFYFYTQVEARVQCTCAIDRTFITIERTCRLYTFARLRLSVHPQSAPTNPRQLSINFFIYLLFIVIYLYLFIFFSACHLYFIFCY